MFREEDFPKLETFNKNSARHTPKIQNCAPTILPSGETVRPNPIEDVLNWQTENSLVQNSALISIHKDVTEVKGKVDHIDTTVRTQNSQVSHVINVFERRLEDLKYIMPTSSFSLDEFILNKEKETKFIQDQLHVLRTTGEVPKFDLGPATPPPKVSPAFGATPIRNWPITFYFGNVTTPSPSAFFPDQQQPASKPFDIGEVLREYRRNKQIQKDAEEARKFAEKEERQAEKERKRKNKQTAQEPPSSLMYNIHTNPVFSLEQETKANEATKVYDNPLSSMLHELHDESVPYISTYVEESKSSESVSIEEDCSLDL